MMQRTYPFNGFWRLNHALGRMQPRQGRDFGWTENPPAARNWSVPLDVSTNGEDTVIRASLPGMAPEDIQVSLEDRVLTIKGQTSEKFQDTEGEFVMRERRTGSFFRALRLPESVDADKVHPHYEHGILTITLPKSEAKRARQIPVQVGAEPAPAAAPAIEGS